MSRCAPLRGILLLILLAGLLALPACAGSKTRELWVDDHPGYITLSVFGAPPEFKQHKDQHMSPGDDWYWSDDGRWLFIKRPLFDRCFEYAGKTLVTPIAMTWDGVITVARVLDGSVSEEAGNFATGLATLAAIFSGHGP